jgi:hypothetical protein
MEVLYEGEVSDSDPSASTVISGDRPEVEVRRRGGDASESSPPAVEVREDGDPVSPLPCPLLPDRCHGMRRFMKEEAAVVDDSMRAMASSFEGLQAARAENLEPIASAEREWVAVEALLCLLP